MNRRGAGNLRSVWSNLLLVGGSVAAAVAFGEVVLRTLDIPRLYDLHSVPAQFSTFQFLDGTALWRNEASSTIRFVYDGNPRGYFGDQNEVDHRTNALGFRGGEFQPQKAPQAFRIAFVGDSFTFGEGVKDPDTYSERTSRVLSEAYEGHAVRFESFNFGVGGFNLVQGFATLTQVALPLSPDLVVLKIDLLDFEPSITWRLDPEAKLFYRDPRWYEEPGNSIADQPPDNLFLTLNLTKLAWHVLHQRSVTKNTIAYYNSLMADTNPGWAENRAALRGAIDACRANGLPCIVLCFPILHGLEDEDYPFFHAHAAIRKEVESSGALFVDLLDHLRGLDARDLWVHPTDRHPNEVVHAVAARELAGAIVRSGIVPSRLPGANGRP